MKLELKHLAPYLPYDLKYCRVGKNISTLKEEVKYMGIVSTKGTVNNLNNTLFGDFVSMKYLPLLRPLSDLTKEIEVNDEKFVPIVELAKLFHTCKSAITHFSNIVNAGFYGASVNCHIENDDSRFTYYQLRNDEFVLSNTYDEIQKLLEWHFDVFGLIEQGLAVDINTLEK